MMILGTFRSCMLGALLAGTAAPSLAAAPVGEDATAEARPVAGADSRDVPATHSRRVELPFPLDERPPDRRTPPPASRKATTPHPFRERQLQRASLGEGGAGPATIRVRLSRLVKFG
jgi:hypothetical protein